MKLGKIEAIGQLVPPPRELYAWLIKESAEIKTDRTDTEIIKEVLELVPLVCFALVDVPSVVGNPIQGVGVLNGKLFFVEQDSHFLGYYSTLDEELIRAARRYLELPT